MRANKLFGFYMSLLAFVLFTTIPFVESFSPSSLLQYTGIKVLGSFLGPLGLPDSVHKYLQLRLRSKVKFGPPHFLGRPP